MFQTWHLYFFYWQRILGELYCDWGVSLEFRLAPMIIHMRWWLSLIYCGDNLKNQKKPEHQSTIETLIQGHAIARLLPFYSWLKFERMHVTELKFQWLLGFLEFWLFSLPPQVVKLNHLHSDCLWSQFSFHTRKLIRIRAFCLGHPNIDTYLLCDTRTTYGIYRAVWSMYQSDSGQLNKSWATIDRQLGSPYFHTSSLDLRLVLP